MDKYAETTYLFMKKTSMKPLLMHPCGWPQISRSAVRTAASLPWTHRMNADVEMDKHHATVQITAIHTTDPQEVKKSEILEPWTMRPPTRPAIPSLDVYPSLLLIDKFLTPPTATISQHQWPSHQRRQPCLSQWLKEMSLTAPHNPSWDMTITAKHTNEWAKLPTTGSFPGIRFGVSISNILHQSSSI